MVALINIKFGPGFVYRYTSVVHEGQWVVFASGDVVDDFNEAALYLYRKADPQTEILLSELADRFLDEWESCFTFQFTEEGIPQLARKSALVA